jgi:hypothetical protein
MVGYRTWLTAELTGSGSPAFISDGGGFSPPGGTTPDDMPWASPPLDPTTPAIYVQLYCSTGAASDCQLDSATPLSARGIETDLYETVTPGGTIDGGTLLTSDVQRGRRSVLFTATDDESGVARVELLLGSVVVDSVDLDADPSKCAHTDWAACPTRETGTLSVDTSDVADGSYVPALRVTDAAGNRRVIKYQDAITVGNAATGASSDGSPGRENNSASLTAQFAADSRSTYTTSFGTPVRIRGRLRDSGGAALPNVHVAVTAKLDSGGSARSLTATTGTDGRFSFRVSGREPSRRIDIAYLDRSGSNAPIAHARLRLRVKAAATLHVVLRGIVVRYSGRVVAGPIPRGGKQIFVQGRAKGGAWQRFAAKWSDASGRFSGTYRLRVRRPGVKLQFRVEVPRQSNYPYVPHTGKSVTRTVR